MSRYDEICSFLRNGLLGFYLSSNPDINPYVIHAAASLADTQQPSGGTFSNTFDTEANGRMIIYFHGYSENDAKKFMAFSQSELGDSKAEYGRGFRNSMEVNYDDGRYYFLISLDAFEKLTRRILLATRYAGPDKLYPYQEVSRADIRVNRYRKLQSMCYDLRKLEVVYQQDEQVLKTLKETREALDKRSYSDVAMLDVCNNIFDLFYNNNSLVQDEDLCSVRDKLFNTYNYVFPLPIVFAKPPKPEPVVEKKKENCFKSNARKFKGFFKEAGHKVFHRRKTEEKAEVRNRPN